ncbi:unnamed protein product [Oppiella nova]|uniref:Uncharacterized protein n=1 Tax=Oppiella nova TaxID=334625 RepID=A0A7R9R151_9ACAR|nr:unnamed protein product [Oppiella nova]CAG2181714.1 unnamed protein product [Oppiella nova]
MFLLVSTLFPKKKTSPEEDYCGFAQQRPPPPPVMPNGGEDNDNANRKPNETDENRIIDTTNCCINLNI